MLLRQNLKICQKFKIFKKFYEEVARKLFGLKMFKKYFDQTTFTWVFFLKIKFFRNSKTMQIVADVSITQSELCYEWCNNEYKQCGEVTSKTTKTHGAGCLYLRWLQMERAVRGVIWRDDRGWTDTCTDTGHITGTRDMSSPLEEKDVGFWNDRILTADMNMPLSKVVPTPFSVLFFSLPRAPPPLYTTLKWGMRPDRAKENTKHDIITSEIFEPKAEC